MKNILDLIEKGKIFNYMINIFLILPILYLTHLFYVAKYGHYIVYCANFSTIINSLYETRTWFAIIIFTLIFVIVGITESLVLPYITILKKKKNLTLDEKHIKVFINYTMKSMLGFNIYNTKYQNLETYQREFYSTLYKIPMALFLYSVCLIKFKLLMIIMFLISVYFFYSIYKALIIYKN